MNQTAAVCGLYCESCGIYIATRNGDGNELERLARMMKTTAVEIRCEGCRTKVLSPHCRNCEFRDCAAGKGLENCEDCRLFPCVAITEFQRQAPHRAELFESARYRKAEGVEAWLEKMERDYSCPSCGRMNSPYYAACPECGTDPCNEFRKRNEAALKK